MPEAAQDRSDAEHLADAVLHAVEADLESPERDTSSTPDAMATAAFALRRLGIDVVRRYNRLEVEAADHTFLMRESA